MFTVSEHIERLALQAGYELESNEYVQRRTVNKKEGIDVARVFIQGKFEKPKVSPKLIRFMPIL